MLPTLNKRRSDQAYRGLYTFNDNIYNPIMKLTLLGLVPVEVFLGPEAAEEVLSHVQLGPLHGCVEI